MKEKRRYNHITPEIEQKVIKLREGGKTLYEIRDELNLGVNSIIEINKKNGMERGSRFISQDEEKIIRKLVEDGKTVRDISNLLDYHYASISRFLIKNNIQIEKYAPLFPLTIEQGEKVKEYVLLGYGREKIADLLQVKVKSVRNFCQNNNIINEVALLKSNKITPQIGQEIIDLKKQGFNSVQIGKKFDINKGTIVRYLRRNGIDPSKKKRSPEEEVEYQKYKRLRKNFSKAIHRVLRERGNSDKYHSLTNYLPYTVKELKAHLEKQFEPWMTWENWGVYSPKTWDDNDISTWVWHIDHIIPDSEFRYTSMENESFKKCWALENLRPYPAKQNVIDGAHRIRHSNPVKKAT